jgi:septal ring factor EnvC (AmiA/AmiB activator)
MIRTTIVLILLGFVSAFGQTQKSRAALEAEKKENLKRIEEVKKILGETQKEKNSSLSQAKALQRQIENQEKKISLAQQDFTLISKEMEVNMAQQDTLRKELEVLQREYAEIIIREAKNSSKITKLGFLFSSKSLTELFMRYKYLNQYSENRKAKFEKMKQLTATLKKRQAELAQGKVRQENVIKQVSEDKKGLDNLKTKQDAIVKDLTSKEGQLKVELKKQQNALRQLNSVISVAIAKERAARKAEEEAKALAKRKAEEAARAEAARKEAERKRVAESGTKTAERPTVVERPKEEAKSEVAKVSAPTRTEVATVATGKFSAAKNKLAWPASGFISSRFGVRDHAVLKGIKVDNHGVDIRTSEGAEVRAVFEGVVLDISQIPGLNYVVAVQHGDYYTVYANLASVAVRVNQKVSGREILGTVAEKDGVPEINFQVWHNFTKLNPELWLGSK